MTTPLSSTRRAPSGKSKAEPKRAVRVSALPQPAPDASAPVEPTPAATPVAPETPSVTAPKTEKPRAVKKRTPRDLSGEYARADKPAKAERVAVPVEPVKTVLRGKAAREAKAQRQQSIQVSDELLQRLRAKPEAKSAPLVIETGKPEGRKGGHECGKCGTARRFSTPATLCGCGAILVKA